MTQIEFDNVFGALNATIKVRVSFLDARKQVASFRLKLTGFRIQNTVLVMY